MKIAVVCTNGRVAKAVVREAVARGLRVKAIQRREEESEAQETLIKDLYALTYDDLADCDAVVDAFGAWTPETLPEHGRSLRYLCDLLSGKHNRLLVVGGAGSLYVDAEHTACVSEGADFPEAFRPLAAAMAAALEELRGRDDVNWTYVSPACDFRADGERTGAYLLGGEELPLNDRGESEISYADYAIALVDEIVSGRHLRRRISVVSR